MWYLIVSLAIGMAIGRFARVTARQQKGVSCVGTCSLVVLLISLGASNGANDELMRDLPVLGGCAVCLAVAAIAGSVLFAWITQQTLLRDLCDGEPGEA